MLNSNKTTANLIKSSHLPSSVNSGRRQQNVRWSQKSSKANKLTHCTDWQNGSWAWRFCSTAGVLVSARRSASCRHRRRDGALRPLHGSRISWRWQLQNSRPFTTCTGRSIITQRAQRHSDRCRPQKPATGADGYTIERPKWDRNHRVPSTAAGGLQSRRRCSAAAGGVTAAACLVKWPRVRHLLRVGCCRGPPAAQAPGGCLPNWRQGFSCVRAMQTCATPHTIWCVRLPATLCLPTSCQSDCRTAVLWCQICRMLSRGTR